MGIKNKGTTDLIEGFPDVTDGFPDISRVYEEGYVDIVQGGTSWGSSEGVTKI